MPLRGHPHSDQKDKRACQGDSEEEHHQTGTCGLSLTNCTLRIVHRLNSWPKRSPASVTGLAELTLTLRGAKGAKERITNSRACPRVPKLPGPISRVQVAMRRYCASSFSRLKPIGHLRGY